MLVLKLNNGEFLNIEEDYLVVKDNKLYNTKTKRFEGVDGDHVYFTTFLSGGTKCITSGTVDGYTNENRIKLRGAMKTYENVKDVNIEHFRSVEVYTDDNSVVLEQIIAD
jgi:hypothetical protein